LEHKLFYDGTKKEFSWIIQTGNNIRKEVRTHPPAYYSGYKLDVKNDEQSKFIALHVGIYWGLGVFIIKNGDTVNVMCDSKKMIDLLHAKCETTDQIINDKIKFTNHLIEQRKLIVNYYLIDSNENPASDLIR
jgi:hypothetical protein|tara:strand:+ start:189 stop:587 length:399 start_codon:yes stop_codon:yes gene_type:complete